MKRLHISQILKDTDWWLDYELKKSGDAWEVQNFYQPAVILLKKEEKKHD